MCFGFDVLRSIDPICQSQDRQIQYNIKKQKNELASLAENDLGSVAR